MSADPNRGKYCRKSLFGREFHTARDRLSGLNGRLEPGVHDFEAFTFTIVGKLRLIFYPHTTRGTGNQHIRVRSLPGADKKLLRKAIFALAENTCTFQYPMDADLHREAVLASLQATHKRRSLDATETASGLLPTRADQITKETP